MSGAAADLRAEGGGGRATTAAIILAVGAATVVAVVASGGRPGFAALPVALIGAAALGARLPLRASATVLLAALLTLDLSTDAAGIWHTPLSALGDLLRDNLERSAGLPGVKLSGLEVILLFLAAVWLHRKTIGDRSDARGQIQTATVLRDFVLIYLAGFLYVELVGLARGSSAAIWKIRYILHVPALFFLFQAAWRGPRDHVLLGRLVVAAACVKALLATWVQRVAAPALTGGRLAYGTNHGDSILFALAAFILVVHFLERPDRRRAGTAALLLPIVLWGLKENDRRLGWVMLAMALLAALLIGPWRTWRRTVTRAALLAAPVLALYVGVGWERGGRLFRPVQLVRSVVDASVDSSTHWRDVENWNVAVSLREHPIVGIGLGGEYTEVMPNADISVRYADFRAWPHNSVLGLLLFGGLFGFTAIWTLFAIVVFLAVRSHRRARSAEERVAALTCLAAVVVCCLLAYGDTGAHFTQYRVFAALALAVVGKLAVATGAWPARFRRPDPDGCVGEWS